MLERLILYYNCIPSLDEVKVLYELLTLRELDLRLNPLTKNYLNYRLYVVQAMPNLRKLGETQPFHPDCALLSQVFSTNMCPSLCITDSCPVRDTERKAAIMQFSSDVLLQKKSSGLNKAKEDNRYAGYQISISRKIH